MMNKTNKDLCFMELTSSRALSDLPEKRIQVDLELDPKLALCKAPCAGREKWCL